MFRIRKRVLNTTVGGKNMTDGAHWAELLKAWLALTIG